MVLPFHKRSLAPFIQKDLKEKMVFIGGPRQVGKTTFAFSFLPNGITLREKHPAYLNWDFSEDRERILKGEFPIFSWGTSYMGTLQSYINALFFFLFGWSRQVFIFGSALFYIGYGFSLYYLARSLFRDFRWQAAVVGQ